ncbi:hypothetical protein [Anaerotignum sp. MB30-C6]|nr:hypothetical protein [Anaerotignum sp. MB30-C6]WMI82091.1 hypothetical protein RBQ60_04980 [Anaerotignum sp. MB30-C6]
MIQPSSLELGQMTNAQLLEYGLSHGADVNSRMKKVELISAIEGAV